ncbi:hypothetical protein HDV05_003506 [Chytridiales sp. JEL 0842]|nr:hypothetical protein HDV05_003506 [Chytridiales sp. JEL 0842]
MLPTSKEKNEDLLKALFNQPNHDSNVDPTNILNNDEFERIAVSAVLHHPRNDSTAITHFVSNANDSQANLLLAQAFGREKQVLFGSTEEESSTTENGGVEEIIQSMVKETPNFIMANEFQEFQHQDDFTTPYNSFIDSQIAATPLTAGRPWGTHDRNNTHNTPNNNVYNSNLTPSEKAFLSAVALKTTQSTLTPSTSTKESSYSHFSPLESIIDSMTPPNTNPSEGLTAAEKTLLKEWESGRGLYSSEAYSHTGSETTLYELEGLPSSLPPPSNNTNSKLPKLVKFNPQSAQYTHAPTTYSNKEVQSMEASLLKELSSQGSLGPNVVQAEMEYLDSLQNPPKKNNKPSTSLLAEEVYDARHYRAPKDLDSPTSLELLSSSPTPPSSSSSFENPVVKLSPVANLIQKFNPQNSQFTSTPPSTSLLETESSPSSASESLVVDSELEWLDKIFRTSPFYQPKPTKQDFESMESSILKELHAIKEEGATRGSVDSHELLDLLLKEGERRLKEAKLVKKERLVAAGAGGGYKSKVKFGKEDQETVARVYAELGGSKDDGDGLDAGMFAGLGKAKL